MRTRSERRSSTKSFEYMLQEQNPLCDASKKSREEEQTEKMEYQQMKQYHLIRYYQIHSNHSQMISTRRAM
eukprot:1362054-Amphidinium_carterae.1